MHGAALYLGGKLSRGALQHQWQLACLLAQTGKHGNQAGKALFLRQGRGQRRAFAHQHQRVHGIGTQGAVVQGFGSGLQCFQYGYTSACQHGQRAGKAGRVVAAREAAYQRQVQPLGIKAFAKGLVLERHAKACSAHNQQAQHEPAVVAHKVADVEHDRGQKGQRALGAGKHTGHLRHHVADQKDDDDDGHQCHDGRVQRCANQLGLQGLARFQIIGQILQHRGQTAAGFACANHCAEDVGKLAWVLLQRPCKAGAGIDLGAQRCQQLVLALVFGLIGQRGQRALDGQARADQPGELARPDCQTGGVEDRACEPA